LDKRKEPEGYSSQRKQNKKRGLVKKPNPPLLFFFSSFAMVEKEKQLKISFILVERATPHSH
jgi:hypothetical protein